MAKFDMQYFKMNRISDVIEQDIKQDILQKGLEKNPPSIPGKIS